jgi:hypothetical protein
MTMQDPVPFTSFYRDHFLDEHQHPANIALHMLGVAAGLGLLVASLTVISGWWGLAFPVVHVVPGLIGHRLFERNEAVGDSRVMRQDFPLWWFLVANHVMAARLMAGRR